VFTLLPNLVSSFLHVDFGSDPWVIVIVPHFFTGLVVLTLPTIMEVKYSARSTPGAMLIQGQQFKEKRFDIQDFPLNDSFTDLIINDCDLPLAALKTLFDYYTEQSTLTGLFFRNCRMDRGQFAFGIKKLLEANKLTRLGMDVLFQFMHDSICASTGLKELELYGDFPLELILPIVGGGTMTDLVLSDIRISPTDLYAIGEQIKLSSTIESLNIKTFNGNAMYLRTRIQEEFLRIIGTNHPSFRHFKTNRDDDSRHLQMELDRRWNILDFLTVLCAPLSLNRLKDVPLAQLHIDIIRAIVPLLYVHHVAPTDEELY
jgi:hypothetical protein